MPIGICFALSERSTCHGHGQLEAYKRGTPRQPVGLLAFHLELTLFIIIVNKAIRLRYGKMKKYFIVLQIVPCVK